MKKTVAIGVTLVLSVIVSCADTTNADISKYEEPDQLRTLLLDPPDDLYLIDTRTAEEYAAGHIPSARHIDYRVIGDNLPTQDTNALIIVYCLSGSRSNRAARTLRSLGFTRVLDWGGITSWPYQIVSGSEPGALPGQ